MSFIETAYAMGPQAGGGAGGDNLFASLMPFALIFLVFYFLLIRPQQKKAKEHKQMLSALKKGDPVITAGGMYGRIVEVDGDVMIVDLGETKVTMNRGFLSAAPQQKQAAPPLKKEKKGRKDAAREVAQPEAPSKAPAGEAVPASETEAKAGDAPANDTDKPAVQ